jgi:hypothetical protein
MGIARGAAGLVAAALVAGLVGVAAPAGAGGPTTITVTTTADVVDAGDGLTSLREAVIAASADPSVTDIVLADDATYALTECDAPNELGNGLQLLHDGPLLIRGDGTTVEQTCEGARLLDYIDGSQPEEDLHAVTLEGMTLRSSAEAPESLLFANAWVVLQSVTLTGPFGVDSAIATDGLLQIEDSVFEDLVLVDDSRRELIAAFSGLEIRDSVFRNNDAAMVLNAADATLENVEVVGGSYDDGVAWLFRQASLDHVTVRDVDAFGGVVFDADPIPSDPTPPSFSMRNSVIAGNTLGRAGAGSLGALLVNGVDPEVTGTSIVGNTAVDGSAGVGGFDVEVFGISNSTIAGNIGAASAPVHEWPAVVVDGGSLDLQHTTITGNTVPAGQPAVEAESLSAEGSVIDGPGDDCAIASFTGSGGGNVAGDATCGFDHGTDQESVPDLGLTELDLDADVPVLVPLPSSPLVDVITAPGCGSLLPFDQRGLPRPSPLPTSACDAGSVELQQPFSDVPFTHTFFSDIGWAADNGIAGGFADGTYRPGAAVARQAMAAFLYRLAGEPAFDPPLEATFSDVPEASTFFAEIEWLAGEGIAGGFADGTFRPGQAVSRQAMAAFLYRFEGEPAFTPPGVPSFSDVPATGTFFHEVEWLTDAGVAEGFADGTFRPAQPVTRQAMAAFLHRLSDL